MFTALAHLAVRRHWLVIIAVVIFGIVAGVIGGPVAGLLKGGGFDDPHSESTAARLRVQRAVGSDPAQGVIALIRLHANVHAAASQREVTRVARIIGADPGVKSVVDVVRTPDPHLISTTGAETYVVGDFKPATDTDYTNASDRIIARLAGDRAVTVGGATPAGDEVGSQVGQDLGKAEGIAFPILFLLLLFVFRTPIAAVLPLLAGGLTIVGTFLGLRLIVTSVDLSIFALNLVIALGLGLSIDYSLLIVSRFREELVASGSVASALARTLNTAGRTVVFSALTVTAALASLLVFPQQFLYSMGIGGIVVTIMGASMALLFLPAVLALTGKRIDALYIGRRRASTDRRQGGWYRIASFTMRQPVLVAVLSAGVLLALGTPFLGIKFNSVDASDLPGTAAARQVNDALISDFPGGSNRLSPIQVIVEANTGTVGRVNAFARSIVAIPGIASIDQPRRLSSDTWEIDAFPKAGLYTSQSIDAVKRIRGATMLFPFLVGGRTAEFVDLQSGLSSRLPIILAIMLIATLLVLFLATGSIVIPIKSFILNLLTLSATFGALVLVFQDGRFENILGYTSQGALDQTQPILLFVLAFGLSTDYSVFLLTRIKEGHDRGLSTKESVAAGLEHTGRIVTAAAVLFCIAVGAFATSSIIFIKEVGLGTAFAVLVDSTIVRALLLPSLMALLGDWNWWAPRPLRVLHQRLGLDRLEGNAPVIPLTAELSRKS